MKRLCEIILIPIFLLSVIVSCTNETGIDNTINRNGIVYMKPDIGSPYTGHVFERYGSGLIKMRGYYESGIKDDDWSYFDTNGRLVNFEQYLLGKLIRQTTWDNQGKIILEKMSVDSGYTLKFREYFPDGHLKLNGSFRDDEEFGKWTHYNIDGKIIRIDY